MDIDDCEAILQSHPEMILISETPAIWQGFLSVSYRSNSGRCTRVKIKLKAPNYPSLCDAKILFGKKIAFLRNDDFTRRVADLMRNASRVSSFFTQLQSLISNFINEMQSENDTYDASNNMTTNIIDELKDALETRSEVRLLSDSNLNTIKLYFRNMSLTLHRTKRSSCPWTVVSSDLPEIPVFGPFEINVSTLCMARNKFKLQVEMFESSWSVLREIDENCRVIDPLQPQPCHLYRRIYLTPSLSMFVKIDPLNPMDLPEIKFLGSEIEVEKQKDIVSNNLHNWNPRCSIIENLLMLLDIAEFPHNELNEHVKDENVLVSDNECCICFALKLDDENFPDKICSNEKCKRHFHSCCLLQWLQAVAGNHISFNYIHGVCPHCGEQISCCIK